MGTTSLYIPLATSPRPQFLPDNRHLLLPTDTTISALVGGEVASHSGFSCISLLLTDADIFSVLIWLFLYLPRRKNFLWILRKLM